MLRPLRLLATLILLGASAFAGSTVLAQRGEARPPSPSADAAPTLVDRLRWGDGPTDLGRIEPEEHAPEGPQAIAVGGDGSLFILDSVHSRILKRRGSEWTEFARLPGTSWEALAALDQGGVAALDRLVGQQVSTFDGTGRPKVSLDIVGLVAEPGLITSLRAGPDALWLEVEHGTSTRLSRESGRVVRVDGRVAGDDVVRARVFPPARVNFLVSRSGTETIERTVTFGRPLLQLAAVEPDGRGGWFVVAETSSAEAEAELGMPVTTEVLHVDHSGRELSRRDRTRIWSPYEPLQPFAPTPDGGLLQLVTTEDGVEIWRW
jgi:hypothetical protein